MARRCSKTNLVPEECWCDACCDDPELKRQRKIVAEAKFEFRGGEALHVFVSSKVGPNDVSLCNLREAVTAEELKRLRKRGQPDPKNHCDQCIRTLKSRVPNARMRRYLAARGIR